MSLPSSLPRGPMFSGHYKGRRLNLTSDTFEAVGKFKKGLIKKKNWMRLKCAPVRGGIMSGHVYGEHHGLCYRGPWDEPRGLRYRPRCLVQEKEDRV